MKQSGGRSRTMKGDTRMTRLARVIGFLAVLALLLGLLLPLMAAAAQETNADEDVATTEALSEVPSTGARRPGPVVLAATRVAAPETKHVEGVAPVELQIDSVGVDAPIELGNVTDGAMQDPSGPWVVSWYEPLGKIGEGGNVVMAGHVDYWNVGPAVFWDVRDLPAG